MWWLAVKSRIARFLVPLVAALAAGAGGYAAGRHAADRPRRIPPLECTMDETKFRWRLLDEPNLSSVELLGVRCDVTLQPRAELSVGYTIRLHTAEAPLLYAFDEPRYSRDGNQLKLDYAIRGVLGQNTAPGIYWHVPEELEPGKSAELQGVYYLADAATREDLPPWRGGQEVELVISIGYLVRSDVPAAMHWLKALQLQRQCTVKARFVLEEI